MKYRQGDTKYAFAVGKIRQLETRLLDRQAIERLIEAEDADESIKLLSENQDYSQDIKGLKNPASFENILEAQLDSLYKLFKFICQEHELLELCRLKYDLLNLKIIIRNIAGEQKDFEARLNDRGNIAKFALKEAVVKKEFRDMPKQFADMARHAVLLFETTKDPQKLDIFIDKYFYKVVFGALDKDMHSFLYKYYQMAIDLANIKIFLRIKQQTLGAGILKESLIENGTITAKSLLGMYDTPFVEFTKKMQRTDYWASLGDEIEDWSKTGSLEKFEKASDDYLIEYLKQAKYLAFGFEPLAGYMFAKENEVKIIRNVLVGKLYGRPEASIRESLRQSYV